MTPQTKNIDDKDREQVGHTSALNCGEASEKSKPLEENRQHASLSQSAREEKEEKSKKRGGKWRSTKTIPPGKSRN